MGGGRGLGGVAWLREGWEEAYRENNVKQFKFKNFISVVCLIILHINKSMESVPFGQ